jgi:hypothetical protein
MTTNLRIVNVQVVSSTEIQVTFTENLTPHLVTSNVSIIANTPNVLNSQVLGISVTSATLTVTCQPLIPFAAYFIQFVSTTQNLFESLNGDAKILQDGISNQYLITGPISPDNPVKDYFVKFFTGNIYNVDVDNSVVAQYINAMSTNLARCLYDIRQVQNENYLSFQVVDEQQFRGSGPYDRLYEEGAYEVMRVGLTPTNAVANMSIILTDFPNFPVTLQQQANVEVLTPSSTDQAGTININTLILNLDNSPITQVTSVVFTLAANPSIYTYNVQLLGYQLENSTYDQNYASSYDLLASNQVQLNTQILNDPLFNINQILNVTVQYQSKDLGRVVNATTVKVFTTMTSVREVLPPIENIFNLQHAPITDASNNIPLLGGVSFLDPNSNTGSPHPAFLMEIPFRLSAPPSGPGQYSIDYTTGTVYVFGASLSNDGTGPSPPLATYDYRFIYVSESDYVYDVDSLDFVALPLGNLINNAGTITFNYEEVLVPNVDYFADTHIESLTERIQNRLIALNTLTTLNSPITNVFQIYNETSGEIYTLERWTNNNQIYFQYNNPPRVLQEIGERATFQTVANELLFVNTISTNTHSLRIFTIFLANNTIIDGTEDGIGASINSSLTFSNGNVFQVERWYNQGLSATININHLLNPGEYMVDYVNGIVYLGVSNIQPNNVGFANYKMDSIVPQFPHVLSVDDIYYRISPLAPKNKEFPYESFTDGSIIPSGLQSVDEDELNGNAGAPYQLYQTQVGTFFTGTFVPGVTNQVKFVRGIFEFSDLSFNTNPINFASASTSNNFNITVNSLNGQSFENVQFNGSYYVTLNQNISYLSSNIQFQFNVVRVSDGATLWNGSGMVIPSTPNNPVLTLILPGINTPHTGDLVSVTYTYTIAPLSRIVADYNKGDYFVDYTYLADEILVSYEYGDNVIDFSSSNAVSAGTPYYVTYRAGALRDALVKNFGTLVNLPELATLDVNFSRERYRDALTAALTSFLQGPTVAAIKNIGQIISHIEPQLIESSFQTWSLGQGLLYPKSVQTTGSFQLLPAHFGDGVLVNQPGQTITMPINSNIRFEEGTFEQWIIPQWNGLDNDASLTFSILRDGYIIAPYQVFIGGSEYHPTISNGLFTLNKNANVTGLPNTHKDGVFIWYGPDISGTYNRWYLEVIDGYVESTHIHSAYKIVIKTNGTFYDNQSLTSPTPSGMSFFTGLNSITLNLTGGLIPIPPPPSPPPIINLGTASTFGILAASTVTNTGFTVDGGDLGLYPGTSVTGFPPGIVNGTQYITDATAQNAQSAVTSAFTAGNLLTPTTTFPPIHDIGGATLTPGVYSEPSSLGITGTVTLDAAGDPNAYWVFQIGSTLTTAAGDSVVSLINEAQPANVFWLVGSSATLGTNTTFAGSILALASVTATTGANITGRLLAQTAAVTLDDNQIVLPPTPPPSLDGYVGIDSGLTFLSDLDHYLLDLGKSKDRSRLSIFKDVSGYMNFRVWDRTGTMYSISANISNWRAGQAHQVAASWKLNTRNEQDEMHLFLDGLEVPNIIKYGQKLQPYLNENFRTVDSEEPTLLQSVLYDIVGSDDLTTVAGSNVVTSSINFSNYNIAIGNAILINEVGFSSTGYTILNINGQTLLLNANMPLSLPGDGNYSVNQTNFYITSDINVVPNITVSTIHNGVEVELPGVHALRPDYAISQDSNFNNILTIYNGVFAGDPIFVNTLGLNNRNVKKQYYIWSNQVENVFMTQLPPPISLDEADITKIITPTTIVPPTLTGTFTVTNGSDTAIATVPQSLSLVGQMVIFSSQPSVPYTISAVINGTTVILTSNYTGTTASGVSANLILPTAHPSNSQNGRTIQATIAGNNAVFPVQVTLNGVNSSLVVVSETITFSDYGTMSFTNRFISLNYVNVVAAAINPAKPALTVQLQEAYPITYSESSGLVPVIRYSYPITQGYNLCSDGYGVVTDGYNLFSGLDIGNILFIASPVPVAGFYLVTGLSADRHSLNIIPTVASFPLPLANFTGGVYQVLDTTEYRSGLQNGFFTLEASLMPGQAYFLSSGFYQFDYATYLRVKMDPLNGLMYFGSNMFGYGQADAILDQTILYSVMLTDTRVGEVVAANERSITKDYNSLIPITPSPQTLVVLSFDQFPFNNSAPVYCNTNTDRVHFQSNWAVNDTFEQSLVILNQPVLVPNTGILDTHKQGTIEFWLSPLFDTANDPNQRYYFDAYGAVVEQTVSSSDVTVNLSSPASQILSVKLAAGDPGVDYFVGGKLEINTQNAIQEDGMSLGVSIVKTSEPILQVITVKIAGDFTGTDYFAGGSVGPDGQTIYLGKPLPISGASVIITYQPAINSNHTLNTQVIRLNRRLPFQNSQVVVNYIPAGLQGDRLSIYKDTAGYINFAINASGNNFVVRGPTRWAKNTWHRIKASYQINGGVGQDQMLLFLDGYQYSDVTFGQNYLFGPFPLRMGGITVGDGYGVIANIQFKDPINDLFIGTQYNQQFPAFTLLDNFRISDIFRPIYAPYGGPIDVNYNSNLSAAIPVTTDLYTTYLMNYDDMIVLNQNFAILTDREVGSFDFTLNVFDSFGIVESSPQVKQTLEALINTLKPANTVAFINYYEPS